MSYGYLLSPPFLGYGARLIRCVAGRHSRIRQPQTWCQAEFFPIPPPARSRHSGWAGLVPDGLRRRSNPFHHRPRSAVQIDLGDGGTVGLGAQGRPVCGFLERRVDARSISCRSRARRISAVDVRRQTPSFTSTRSLARWSSRARAAR